jgi:hypothetical protein
MKNLQVQGGTVTDPRLIAAQQLDESYASAAAFDAKQQEAWLQSNTVLLCKRTDFPKLGYIIFRLNEAGIPSKLHGQSFHAPCLYVPTVHEAAAWAVLDERASARGKRLDDLADDNKRFAAYNQVQPNADLWGDTGE